jgi:hypothetical protein
MPETSPAKSEVEVLIINPEFGTFNINNGSIGWYKVLKWKSFTTPMTFKSFLPPELSVDMVITLPTASSPNPNNLAAVSLIMVFDESDCWSFEKFLPEISSIPIVSRYCLSTVYR